MQEVQDLWAALGYDAVADEVAKALQDPANNLVVIDGPPGVGKSWLARGIGALWQQGGGSTIVAEGDLLRSDMALYPFGFTMAGLSGGWKAVVPAAAGLARAGEALIGTAGIITGTVELIAKTRRSRGRHRTLYLGDAEHQIVHELSALSRKRPILLIADNLHWWDAQSLELLGRLRSSQMAEAFPALKSMRVLAVQTPSAYQAVAHPLARDALLAPSATRRFELGRICRDGFERVLEALGAGTAVSTEATDLIYSLSGGHLALAARCATRVANGELDEIAHAANVDDFTRVLLSERMTNLGTLGREAVAVLEIAAVLGLTFSRDEVLCAAGTDEAETSRLLRACRDEQLIELTDGLGRFVHDLYRQHFLSGADSSRVAITERLADCLRSLRPADYLLRCLNAVDAERPREAAALAVLAGLQLERDGASWSALPPAALDALEHRSARNVLEQMRSALVDLRQYRFAECIATLDRLPRDLAKPVAAEADGLRAMCLMSTRSEDDRQQGRSLLESWRGYEREEPELGTRLMLLLLYGLSHLPDKEVGRTLEGELRQALIDRVSFDLAAKDALYVLDRSSSSLYQPDVSLVRKREAMAYFAPTEIGGVVRRPLEYYRCLVNYGAGLISNARYDEGRRVYDDVAELVSEYPEGTFPRTDYPTMNGLLAAYRAGNIDAAEAAAHQGAIVDSLEATNDPFYAGNALAVYLTLSDDPSSAIEIFDELQARLAARPLPEPSMAYLLGANRCIARYAAGEQDGCVDDWTTLTGTVERIAYVIRPMLVRRHELLGVVLREGRPMSGPDLDRCLVAGGASEFGPMWDNFGRGFRMPEVEMWREN